MTGPEHWHQAEEFLAAAEDSDFGTSGERYFLDAAQAHATLALAAATAMQAIGAPGNPDNARAWRTAILPTPTSSKDHTHA